MAHVPNPTIQQIVGSIGLDTLSEGVTDPLGHALADAAGGIAETERAKRFLSGILGGLSPAQLGHLQTAVRWNGRLAGSTLKAFAGVILRRHHVNHGMTAVVVDAIDDTVEILSRRTEAALTPAQIQIYVGQGVDNAVAHPSTTPSASATAAANNGVTMSATPRPLGPPKDFSLAEFQQALTPLGKGRWATFNRDYLTAAAPGTSTPNEPVSPRELSRAVTLAVWRDEAQMLAILDDATVDDETALWGFLGTAVRYVGDGETRREDQIGDAVDALTTGRTRETVRNGVDAIARGVVWATPRLAVGVAVVILLSLVVSAGFLIAGIVLGHQGLINPATGQIDITLSTMIKASACIIGAGAALMPIALIHGYVGEKWDKLIAVATGPFEWAGNILKAYATARGLST